MRRWRQPAWLQHAALVHSVYGTDVYPEQLLALSERAELAGVVGERAERIAYLFSVTSRDSLFTDGRAEAPGGPDAPSRDERDALVLLHMANVASQAQARDGSPGEWLARLVEVAEPLVDSRIISLPLFIAELATFSHADETLVRRAYLEGLREAHDRDARTARLALAAAVCPVVAEPCIWLAHVASVRGDSQAARSWAAAARKRLLELGASWDKRLNFDEWLALASRLEAANSDESSACAGEITHPRELFEATVNAAFDRDARPATPAAASGLERFHRYVEAFGDGGARVGSIYPELPTQPWYEPREFPLARYLESHHGEIREELLALDAGRFHRESEPIKRSGDWDVAFFYERGRRHDAVCAACPVTTRGIEAYPTVRGPAGLIYVSRMRPATHIQAHRGPTNLRIRCHLAVKVPDGDCAIRVGAETHRWQEGKCLLFDDHFEHEAWNHTDEERIVLVVDLWHPGLSGAEIRLLDGLQKYTYSQARRLGRYWSANAKAAG